MTALPLPGGAWCNRSGEEMKGRAAACFTLPLAGRVDRRSVAKAIGVGVVQIRLTVAGGGALNPTPMKMLAACPKPAAVETARGVGWSDPSS